MDIHILKQLFPISIRSRENRILSIQKCIGVNYIAKQSEWVSEKQRFAEWSEHFAHCSLTVCRWNVSPRNWLQYIFGSINFYFLENGCVWGKVVLRCEYPHEELSFKCTFNNYLNYLNKFPCFVRYIKQFGPNVFSSDGEIVFCIVCNSHIKLNIIMLRENIKLNNTSKQNKTLNF